MADEHLLIPGDPERIISDFLRSQAEVQAAVGDRVYTVMPRDKEFPLITLSRWSGFAPHAEPIAVDMADVQFSVYGDRKKQAQDIAQLVRAILAQRLPAGDSTEGWVTSSQTNDVRYLPDDTVDPPKPRYLFSARLTVRSAAHAV